MSKSVRLRLPATSANLGPGFDALGLALDLALTVEAEAATAFSITATGRHAELVGALEGNLLLDTYRSVAPEAPPLRLRIDNEIPLGMGLGSSAAALLAGVALAAHFGTRRMTPAEVLDEACHREGHPDNVAACFHGGLTASAATGGRVTAATLGSDLDWRLLLALPKASLATEKARALLPGTYSRVDAVGNVQATALLMAAFAQNRPNLLAEGTRDRLHQPYRAEACPLLPALLPLSGRRGVYSATLSGAGPSVLLLCDPQAPLYDLQSAVREAAGSLLAEIVVTRIGGGSNLHSQAW